MSPAQSTAQSTDKKCQEVNNRPLEYTVPESAGLLHDTLLRDEVNSSADYLRVFDEFLSGTIKTDNDLVPSSLFQGMEGTHFHARSHRLQQRLSGANEDIAVVAELCQDNELVREYKALCARIRKLERGYGKNVDKSAPQTEQSSPRVITLSLGRRVKDRIGEAVVAIQALEEQGEPVESLLAGASNGTDLSETRKLYNEVQSKIRSVIEECRANGLLTN